MRKTSLLVSGALLLFLPGIVISQDEDEEILTRSKAETERLEETRVKEELDNENLLKKIRTELPSLLETNKHQYLIGNLSSILQDIKAELQETNEQNEKVKQELSALSNKCQNLENEMEIVKNKANQNEVPIGFIYIQLSSQQDPSSLWPTLTWQDVTSTYSGLFFRALGGSAASFGSTQAAQFPTMEVSYHDDPNPEVVGNVAVTANGILGPNAVKTGFYVSGQADVVGLKFRMGTQEVRPRNSAVKIWKRVG